MIKPSLNDYRLYFVTESRLNRGYSIVEQVEAVLRAGVKIIQLREKEMDEEKFITLALKIAEIVHKENAYLIIDDRVQIVVKSGADGVHLGQHDMPLTEAREILGNKKIIGISVKTEIEALEAQMRGADYLAVNGVFPTQTKTDLGELPGLRGVNRIRNCTNIPVIGIGGIHPENCRSVIEAGADGVAVITAITMSEDMEKVCHLFFENLK